MGLEQGAEDLLHLGDVAADADGRAGAMADLVGARQVVGVGVGVQDQRQVQPLIAHRV